MEKLGHWVECERSGEACEKKCSSFYTQREPCGALKSRTIKSRDNKTLNSFSFSSPLGSSLVVIFSHLLGALPPFSSDLPLSDTCMSMEGVRGRESSNEEEVLRL